MRRDDRPRAPMKPIRKWQRPWVVRDDLGHDDAVQIPCPIIAPLTGEMTNVSFKTEEAKSMLGSGFIGLVSNVDLASDLFNGWRAFSLAFPDKPVEVVEHPSFPELWFVPAEIWTHRPAVTLVVPSGIKVLVFWVRPRVTVIARHKVNGHKGA